jgi:hypothetical protein
MPTPPAASERRWKDTIIAPPGEVTCIIVPFGGTAAGIPAPFVGDMTRTLASARPDHHHHQPMVTYLIAHFQRRHHRGHRRTKPSSGPDSSARVNPLVSAAPPALVTLAC